MKQLFTILALFLMSVSGIAQDKFEFMIIEYQPKGQVIAISIDGEEFYKEKPDWTDQVRSDYNANPLLQQVKKYQELGWELMRFDTETPNGYEFFFAYMKKRI